MSEHTHICSNCGRLYGCGGQDCEAEDAKMHDECSECERDG